MDRRTFLKGLFAVAVTPASVVRDLYSPKRWAGYTYGYTGITAELIKEIRAAHRNTIYQPPKEQIHCATPNVSDRLRDLFEFGILKTKRIGKDIEGNVYKDGRMICLTSWPQPPKRITNGS